MGALLSRSHTAPTVTTKSGKAVTTSREEFLAKAVLMSQELLAKAEQRAVAAGDQRRLPICLECRA